MRLLLSLLTFAAALDGGAVQAQISDAEAKAILSKPLQVSEFSWTAFSPPSAGPPVATHFCVLTRFSGKLAGEGEFVNLYIDEAASGGPRYMLGGRSGQAQLRLTAGWAARDQFVFPPLAAKLPWREAISEVKSRAGCGAEGQASGLSGGYAPFLAGLGGRFAGAGENVMAAQGPSSAPVVSIQACSGKVSATVLGIGGLFHAPLFRTLTGRSKSAPSGTFVAWVKTTYTGSLWQNVTGGAAYSGDSPKFMVPSDEALCGIAGIGGKFNGYGETVDVEQASGSQRVWQARVSRGAGASEPYVAVSVRCLARDQRPL